MNNNGFLGLAAAAVIGGWVGGAITEALNGNHQCSAGYVFVRADVMHPFVQLIDDQGHGVRCEKEGE